jgi:transposase/cell division protein FtsB
MSTAVAAILDGMPEPAELRCTDVDDRQVVTVGATVLFCFKHSDVGMRNVAVATLRSLGFDGRTVAAAFSLSEQYVATVHQRGLREGSAGLVRSSGRPGKLSAQQLSRAVEWHDQGVSNVDIGRRLGVHNSTISRALRDGDIPRIDGLVPDELALSDEPEPQPEPEPRPVTQPELEPEPVAAGSARIGTGVFTSRYAGAMLLHAFGVRVGAAEVFTSAATPVPGRRFDDIALMSAISTVFALGFACMEQAKHPDRAQVGPTVGITVLPELRTLRPRLAAIADAADPLELQRAFVQAMLAADPCTSGVYFVDEHFVPYTGALPVGKGWNTKRRHAEAGRVDTMIADLAGRVVCFTSGEPSGLSSSLPPTLAELKQITGERAKILLGFDRGGAWPNVFTACRKQNVDWITYRRGKLATPAGLPIQAKLARGDKTITVAYTDETVDINGYGPARQITLFEHGQPVLQILTSDTAACAGALIWFIRARWRIENLFKYLDFYGIDYLADYTATIKVNTRPVDNPTRKTARTQLANLTAARDQLRERIGTLHTDRQISIKALNRESAAAQRKIHTLEKKISAIEQELKTIPAKLPANQIDPAAKRAVHRACRRGLQMVLRLLAHNAEHWLAHQLNAYLQDPDEYRAITRNLLHLAGTITYTHHTIHVELDQPGTPRITRALGLLLNEINTNPPHIPGDPRPITYTLKT